MKHSTKDKAAGKAHVVKGKIKEKTGHMTGNEEMEEEGEIEEVDGKVREVLGKMEKEVGE